MFDYEDIIDALEQGDAVLFIGPRLLVGEDGQPLERALYNALDAHNENHDLIRTFYEDDGFFLLHEESYRRRLVRQIKQFYQEEHPAASATLKKLARIPFPLIVSLNPDDLLPRAFEAESLPYHKDFYYLKHPFEDYVQGTRERPLLYGMLGDLEKRESLVLTHKDLFNYLESIFAGKSMAPELRTQIQEARTFIFLGLPFEKWYMQLLLRVLYYISKRLSGLEQYASAPMAGEPHTIFKNEFNIQFVPEAGPAFVAELYERCAEAGLLKENGGGKEQGDKAMLNQARVDIGSDKIAGGLEKAKAVLERHRPKTNELYDRLFTLQQAYNDYRKDEKIGVSDEATRTRIVHNILQLITDAENLLGL
ncbi:MAG: SIR2 family protein [Bacteroidota bacterium]